LALCLPLVWPAQAQSSAPAATARTACRDPEGRRHAAGASTERSRGRRGHQHIVTPGVFDARAGKLLGMINTGYAGISR
jgi:hypothetical protein